MQEKSVVTSHSRGRVPARPTGGTGPVVVAFLNRKGGVGKTSCCHHLAGCFAQSGRRVLLVDADPQASLTQGFWGPQRTEALAKDETLACLFDDALEPDPSRLIVPTAIDGVSLLPSSPLLDTHNVPATDDSASSPAGCSWRSPCSVRSRIRRQADVR